MEDRRIRIISGVDGLKFIYSVTRGTFVDVIDAVVPILLPQLYDSPTRLLMAMDEKAGRP